MTLEDFGYNNIFEKFRLDNDLGSFEIGRVIPEHKKLYMKVFGKIMKNYKKGNNKE
jgi:ribosome biogenesis GTPase